MGENMNRNKCFARQRFTELLGDQRGQATTEYAILVGVIVVIAIVAIIAFRGKISELCAGALEIIKSLR